MQFDFNANFDYEINCNLSISAFSVKNSLTEITSTYAYYVHVPLGTAKVPISIKIEILPHQTKNNTFSLKIY